MLGLQALESGSPGMSTSRPRTRRGLRTLMRRIPQPQVWEDGNDLKPLVSSPRACGLGVSRKAHSPSFRVQPTRMRAWGMILRGRGVGTGPTHAHAGLGHGFLEDVTRKPSSPRACGLGDEPSDPVGIRPVQPTRMRAWGLTNACCSGVGSPAHAHAGLGRRRRLGQPSKTSSPRACGLGCWQAKVR